MSIDLFIIRHGNTFDPGDTLLRVGAGSDLPLSNSGKKQAQQLGAYFKNRALPDQVFCSQLQRTQETANIAMAYADHICTPRPEAWLNEIDYGPDEGQPETKVIERLGKAQLEDWEKNSMVPPGWQVDPSEIRQHWRQFLDTLKQQNSNETSINQTVWVVTSNGIARFVLDVLDRETQDLAQQRAVSRKLKTGHFGHLILSENKINNYTAWCCRAWNVSPED